jgi:hypothetical protein
MDHDAISRFLSTVRTLFARREDKQIEQTRGFGYLLA